MRPPLVEGCWRTEKAWYERVKRVKLTTALNCQLSAASRASPTGGSGSWCCTLALWSSSASRPTRTRPNRARRARPVSTLTTLRNFCVPRRARRALPGGRDLPGGVRARAPRLVPEIQHPKAETQPTKHESRIPNDDSRTPIHESRFTNPATRIPSSE